VKNRSVHLKRTVSFAIMTADDRNTPPSLFSSGGDEDIIELTEAVDQASAEVVLDFGPGSDLSALKGPSEPPPEPDVPAPAPPEESLDDFLATLPELPEDLDIPTATPKAPAAPPAAAAPATPDLRRELGERLSDEELRELVRQVVQETVERLAREVFPEMASQAIDRELARWKKRLSEPD